MQLDLGFKYVPLAVLSLLLVGCDEEQILTTTRNLDRPGPMTMVCAGRVGDAGITTGLSQANCTKHPDGGTGTDGATGTLYGFVANTARGQVAVFRPGASGEPLVDLDRSSPGFGFIPVGSLPSDLKSSPDGCRVVSVNSGSCDISIIDVPGVMGVASGELKNAYGGVVSRVTPHTRSGRPLRARPQEIVIVPDSVPDKGEDLCPQPGTYRAYVTFPRCNLVAEIDLTSGEVLQALRIEPHGFYSVDEPACATECTLREDNGRVDSGPLDLGPAEAMASVDTVPQDLGPVDGAPPDAGPSDTAPPDAAPSDTAPPDAGTDLPPPLDGAGEQQQEPKISAQGVLPYGLALTEDGGQLYVSSAGAGFISVVDVNPESGSWGNPRRIHMSDRVWTTRIKLSPPTQRIGQFLYAIARDRSVRVISTELGRECETNLDLAKLQDGGVPLDRARCFLVGGPDTPPRRAVEKRTGFRFGARLPQDVIFVLSEPAPVDGGSEAADGGPEDAGTSVDAEATPLSGVFALVATSDGFVYVIDVEDWNVIGSNTDKVPTLNLPHRFRNGRQGLVEGIADASVVSVQGAGTGGVPVVVSETLNDVRSDAGEAEEERSTLPGEGVYLRAIGELVSAEWNLVYEDRLLGRWSGNLTVQQDSLTLQDRGADFCASGVLGHETDNGRVIQHGDIVELVGCKEDDECGLEQVCSKPVAQESEYGLCFDEALEQELFNKCRKFLTGKREFLVTRATQDVLTLDALPVEPQAIILQDPQPPAPCVSNEDCDPFFLCAIENKEIEGLPELSIARGQCFRPGCEMDVDCGEGHVCVQPLDGSPKICAPVPLPIELGPTCSPEQGNDCVLPKSKEGRVCDRDKDCGDERAECRQVDSNDEEKKCVDRQMTCSAFPGLKNRCVRTSPCFSELLRYNVRVGRSFVVGTYNRIAADPDSGKCRAKLDESPLLQYRVPVGLPVYPVLVGPVCKQPVSPLELPEPNPCFERLEDEGYFGFTDKGIELQLARAEHAPATVVRFSNPDIWFSLGVSHLATPQSSAVVPDAGVGATTPTPMPERGLTIQLEVGSGFASLVSGTSQTLSFPVWMYSGPDGFVYVVDMGDRAGSTGNRGQVLRLNRSEISLDNFIVK